MQCWLLNAPNNRTFATSNRIFVPSLVSPVPFVSRSDRDKICTSYHVDTLRSSRRDTSVPVALLLHSLGHLSRPFRSNNRRWMFAWIQSLASTNPGETTVHTFLPREVLMCHLKRRQLSYLSTESQMTRLRCANRRDKTYLKLSNRFQRRAHIEKYHCHHLHC